MCEKTVKGNNFKKPLTLKQQVNVDLYVMKF